MDGDSRELRLSELILRGEGSSALRLIRLVFGMGLSIFFRRIELHNAANLTRDAGIIFVSNHPNALIDPALIFVSLPQRVAFLAKHTLFAMPVIGWLIRAVGALPLYRQQDSGSDPSKNRETFRVARDLLKSGGAVALFPEGVSHNSPKLLPLKTGAARIALGAVSVGSDPGSLDLRIVPVGLYYTNKTTFRSEALLHFGGEIRVLPVPIDEHGNPPREAVRDLTARIEAALREVTLNAESESEIRAARIAEEVVTVTTPESENLAERLALLRRFLSESAAESGTGLERRLADYERELGRLGIESEFLDLARYSKRFVLKHAFLRSWYLVLLAPLALAGAVVHFLPYQLCRMIAATQTRKGDHDMTSTVKFLAAMVLMPAVWGAIAVCLAWKYGWLPGLLSVPLLFVSGYVALRSLEEIAELRGWLRAIILFFSKREKFLRLLAERRRLFRDLQ